MPTRLVRVSRIIASLAVIAIAALSSSAQTPTQQFVYGLNASGTAPSQIFGFTKNNQTGALTAIPGSPFTNRLEGGPLGVDGQGKFLFVLNKTSNDISMFQIDQTTGALTEVPASPFAAPPDSQDGFTTPPTDLISIGGEPTGKFMFAGYGSVNGNSPVPINLSALAFFSIDTSTPTSPVLTPISVTTVPSFSPSYIGGTPISLLTDPRGLYLYAGVGISYGGDRTSGAAVYAIQPPATLTLQGTGGVFPTYGTAYAIDPLGRFYYEVGGDVPVIVPCMISPANGLLQNCQNNLLQYLGFTPVGPPVIESSGHYLYIPNPGNSTTIFSIDQTTGIPTQINNPPVVNPLVPFLADPLGPFLYGSLEARIHGYQVDTSSGNFSEITGSPFSTPGDQGCCTYLIITGTPPVPVTGPGAVLFPASASPFSATTGTSSSPQIFSLTNNGTQTLTINSISLTGTNATVFSETNNCSATLAANSGCNISITFNPSATGNFTASLLVTDNASTSPQSVAFTGTGIAPAPTVSLSPNPLVFSGTTPVGTTLGPSPVTVTNMGTGPLQITAVSLGGPNPNDFSQTNNCVGIAVAVSGTCTVNVSFSPLAVGVRTATVVLADDAPGGTQSSSLQATATAPFQLAPSSSSTTGTSQTVTAGQTAQYPLQLTPAAGFTGTVTLTCAGAPTLSTCSVSPNSLPVSGSAAIPFSVSVATTGSSTATMFHAPWPALPFYRSMLALLLFALGVGVCTHRVTLRAASLAALLLLLFTLGIAGCSSGSGGGNPPPVTPHGSYTLTVTATAGNLQPQTIRLTLTVQ